MVKEKKERKMEKFAPDAYPEWGYTYISTYTLLITVINKRK